MSSELREIATGRRHDKRTPIRAIWNWAGCANDVAKAAEGCARVVEAISFDATAMPVEWIRFTPSAFGVLVEVAIDVPDSHSDEVKWTSIIRSVGCPWHVIDGNGPEYLVGMLRETIANLLAHEVAESIRYRGAHAFDPHEPRSK